MATLFKLLGLVALLGVVAVAAFFGDLIWNDSGVFYALAGRDRLETACRPLTLESLAGKGFSPLDLTYAPRPSISFSSGPDGTTRVLSSAITFSDGVNGQRVDGALVCTVQGQTVKVDVSVDQLPRRAA